MDDPADPDQTKPPPDPLVSELRKLLPWNPHALDKIEAAHTPGDDGRCPICRSDGIDSGRVHSPCNILAAVLEAKRGKPKTR